MKNIDPNLYVRLAQTPLDIRSAQRLRFRVFVEELGARHDFIDWDNGLEIDQLDEHVEHLCLFDRNLEAHDPENAVIGVYRLISENSAGNIGGFYSEGEFDITPILKNHGKKLELGRSCIDPKYRGGAAMAMLWSALGGYVEEQNIDYLFGTASFQGVTIEDKRESLANLYYHYLALPELRARVLPKHGINMDQYPEKDIEKLRAMHETPSLIKAYLRLGGVIGDGAFVDNSFNTVDVFVLMQTQVMVQKYMAMYKNDL